MTDAFEQTVSEQPAPVPLLAPREGVPPVVADADTLAGTVAAFASGDGPVAVDAERASGYRYGQRAYLIQLRRAGAGTALIDPIACPDLSELGAAIADAEWVLHAASQDLPCLAEVGMVPGRIFDTELAGRLAAYPRVGLGAMVETVLGFSLEKGHSAVDWSTRPLPEPWLRYAALDVEVLVELRDRLEEVLAEQGKLDWALEEFAAIAAAPPPSPRVDPWRRTSGLHRVRRRRQLAIVRALWEARDKIARTKDVSPGRVIPDTAIVEAALAGPASVSALMALPGFTGRDSRRQAAAWLAAIEAGRAVPDDRLPPSTLPHEGPPPARAWGDKDPAAAERLTAAKTAVAAIADEHGLPTENLLAPDAVRRLSWTPPSAPSADAVAAALRAQGAREWQIRLTAPALSGAFLRIAAHGPSANGSPES
ncbi:HRDC domain-containing protein [Yinghuangia soli]|uniref:HRDC domain-containing protein n=1 Tax=Yinghuangia soli TaxID=2908204 RepID=A0AA41PV10_9ACTN|nr:HRDC domain-containing protein [Yinghuangia soli]MCF2526263.1 HRDC domain-containing protein [Yinghuangia soli]